MDMIVTAKLIDEGYTFHEYIGLIEELLTNNKTTGDDQSAGRIENSRLNLRRLTRIYRTAAIPDLLKSVIENIDEPLTWVVLVEAWCGDGAQIAPYFALLSALNPNIRFRLVLRDENPELMNMFLTDGKRSIPKFICFDSDFNVMATWGPRPTGAKKIFEAYKNSPTMTRDEFHKELHLWYARDKGQAILDEIYSLIKTHCANFIKEFVK